MSRRSAVALHVEVLREVCRSNGAARADWTARARSPFTPRRPSSSHEPKVYRSLSDPRCPTRADWTAKTPQGIVCFCSRVSVHKQHRASAPGALTNSESEADHTSRRRVHTADIRHRQRRVRAPAARPTDRPRVHAQALDRADGRRPAPVRRDHEHDDPVGTRGRRLRSRRAEGGHAQHACRRGRLHDFPRGRTPRGHLTWQRRVTIAPHHDFLERTPCVFRYSAR